MSEKDLTKEKLSLYKNKASKHFKLHLNFKHSPIEPKKAQNDPQKTKIIKKVRKLKFFKMKVISLMNKPSDPNLTQKIAR